MGSMLSIHVNEIGLKNCLVLNINMGKKIIII